MKKRMTNIIAMLMVLVVCVVTKIATVEVDASDVEKEYQLYLADYFCENMAFQDNLNNKLPLPYRKYVEVRRNNPAYNSLISSWKTLTFNLSDVSKYSMKEVGYYETILFDILYDGKESESLLEDLNGVMESTKASTFKKVYKMYGELATKELKDIDKKSDEFKKMTETIQNLKEFEDAFAILGNVSKVLSYCKDIDDLITKCSKAQAISAMSGNISKILSDMAKSSNDMAFVTACNNFSKITSGALTEQQIKNIFIGETAVEKICDEVLSNIWDAIIEECTGYGLAIKAGQELGKSAANILFSTEEDIECVFSMYALYDFEDNLMARIKEYEAAYKKNKNLTNATIYNEAFKLLMKTKLEGIDYSIKYAQITNDKGLINQLFKCFKKQDYETYMKTMGALKDSVKDLLQFVTVDHYNNFISAYEESLSKDSYNEITSHVGIEKKKVLVTEEESQKCILNISSASEKYYGLDFTVSNTLTRDCETYSDVVMSGSVDLNGHTLTIHGDLIQTGGEMKINNGTLNVDGDYKIQKISTTGVTSDSSGYLTMKNVNDTVNIGGDFVTQSSIFNELEAGMMTIDRNFYQYSSRSSNFSSQYNSNHVVIFKGEGIHNVYFESTDGSHFSNLKLEDKATIQFTGEFTGFTLCQDLTIEGNTSLDQGELNLNGHTLTVNGDFDIKSNSSMATKLNKGHLKVNGNLTVDGGGLNCANGIVDVSQNMSMNADIDLAGGIINVQGNLRQNAGNMKINNGTLNVDGDYKIQKISTTGVTAVSSGYLTMKNVNDMVNIGRDFVTQSSGSQYANEFESGTMAIGGNFYQYNGSSFNFVSEYSKDHVVIFKGKGVHNAYFESTTSSHFSNLKLEDHATIRFTGEFTGFTLCQDLTIEGNTSLDYGELNLNGHTLTVNGDFDIKSNSSISTKINKGHLKVNGNLTVDAGGLNCANGIVDVSQNMIMNEDIDLAGGTINVQGNLRQNAGNMKINKGKLNIGGWYKLQKETEAGIIMDSAGYITMKNDSDLINVKGDFITQSSKGQQYDNVLTAGTMEIGGNFYQYNGSSSNFVCRDSHVVILNGTGKQAISFESEYSKFNILSLSKSKSNYTFSRDDCWNKLIENEKECNHSYTSEITTPATCTTEGVITYTCSLCGDTYTDTIAKTEHSYITQIVEPTYTTEGYTLHECSVCGDSYQDTYTTKINPIPAKVKMSGYTSTKNTIRINWKKVSGASGYMVYRYDTSKKKWVSIKTISKGSTVTYCDKKLKAGKTYKYKVKAYKKVDGKKYEGSLSAELKAKTKKK